MYACDDLNVPCAQSKALEPLSNAATHFTEVASPGVITNPLNSGHYAAQVKTSLARLTSI